MKKIGTQGIFYLEPLTGSRDWYWGMDYTSGDLYEAEELFRDGHPVNQNRLVFVRYPDGRTVPVAAEKGQYFGRPVCYEGKITLLMADFPKERVEIRQFDDAVEHLTLLAAIPLSHVKGCYNLMLMTSPLMLTRQGHENKFQIIWPEQVEFEIGNSESFCFRDGEDLYFSAWREDPDYQEEIVVRRFDTGEIIRREPGALRIMPDGQRWILG